MLGLVSDAGEGGASCRQVRPTLPWMRAGTAAMDERERRVVLNEAVFRQTNEALVWLQNS